MKILKIFLMFICISTFMSKSYSQSSALDEKKGFKDFTLCDSYSKWSSVVTYSKIIDGDIKVYEYTGICCQQVFEYKLAKISLGFKDNILQSIYISTVEQSCPAYSEFRTSAYNSLRNSFTLLYGNSRETKKGDNLLCIWRSEKVLLTLEDDYQGLKRNMEGDIIKTSRCNIIISFLTDLKSGF